MLVASRYSTVLPVQHLEQQLLKNSVVDPDSLIQYFKWIQVSMTKNLKKYSRKKLIFFRSKIAIYLYLGIHKGRLSYSRSFQPSKENIQHLKN
jgi:hypothetical protein